MIVNGTFDDGLRGWQIVSGSAFDRQPVPAGPSGQEGVFLIRSIGETVGVLDSDVFEVSLPVLAFRLGGSASCGAAVELRVPLIWALRIPDFPALDPPDRHNYVAIRRAVPTGSDELREHRWQLDSDRGGTGLLGAPAKIRLRIDGPGAHRLLVDHFRLLPEPPPPLHPTLRDWADERVFG